ncbi:VOC family protein [Kineococcus gynurae]|uniref:Putative pterin-4-alpha-carbinolamine dehydratase n=1 Tax=Kineococcus gynurae TaxID=452979 RepID=A0ABV5LNB5_9ACTN
MAISRRALLGMPDVRAGLATLDGWWQDHSRLVTGRRLPSQPEALALLTRVGTVAEELDHHPDVDLRHRDLWFLLSTHSSRGVSALDLELAARIDVLAREAGAEPLPCSVLGAQVAVDVLDPALVLPFWQVVTGYRLTHDHDGDPHLVDPAGRAPDVWFQRMTTPRPGRGRTHLDVYLDVDEAPERVRAAVAAGGVLRDESHAPGWWVLADAEGNEVCVCTVGGSAG